MRSQYSQGSLFTNTSESEVETVGEVLPVWVQQLTRHKYGNTRYVARRCGFCHRLCIEERARFWCLFDACLVHGCGELTSAVLLGRCLDRVVWDEWQVWIVSCGGRLCPDWFFVQVHDCFGGPVGGVCEGFGFPVGCGGGGRGVWW